MAISISTGHLVPYIGRGNPYVVIKGLFAPGLVDVGSAYMITSRLSLWKALGSGTGLSITVSGRATSGYSYDGSFAHSVRSQVALSDYTAGGLSWATPTASDYDSSYANIRNYGLGDVSVYGQDLDIPGAIRMLAGASGLEFGSVGEAKGHYLFGSCLGAPVSSEVTIVVRGRLSGLGLGDLEAFTLGTSSSSYGSYFSQIYTSTYQGVTAPLFDFPDYGTGAGWRLYDVHIYDQPFRSVGLPSYFVNAGKRVQWN